MAVLHLAFHSGPGVAYCVVALLHIVLLHSSRACHVLHLADLHAICLHFARLQICWLQIEWCRLNVAYSSCCIFNLCILHCSICDVLHFAFFAFWIMHCSRAAIWHIAFLHFCILWLCISAYYISSLVQFGLLRFCIIAYCGVAYCILHIALLPTNFIFNILHVCTRNVLHIAFLHVVFCIIWRAIGILAQARAGGP